MALLITPHIRRLIDLALDEDRLGFDVASGVLFANALDSRANFLAKQDLCLSGSDMARASFERIDPKVQVTFTAKEGDLILKGEHFGYVTGPATSILLGERTALNFMQRMSGIATKTHHYVEALANPKIRLTDTRKTLPGYRELDKYAVRCGGGYNHRVDLGAGVMIKDNHIVAAGSITHAVELVRAHAPHTVRVEVEVSATVDAIEAIEAGADIIMLDNMSTPAMQETIAHIRRHPEAKRVLIEASGNVTIERLPELGAIDLDVVSTGAITHSVMAADISLKFAKGDRLV